MRNFRLRRSNPFRWEVGLLADLNINHPQPKRNCTTAWTMGTWIVLRVSIQSIHPNRISLQPVRWWSLRLNADRWMLWLSRFPLASQWKHLRILVVVTCSRHPTIPDLPRPISLRTTRSYGFLVSLSSRHPNEKKEADQNWVKSLTHTVQTQPSTSARFFWSLSEEQTVLSSTPYGVTES